MCVTKRRRARVARAPRRARPRDQSRHTDCTTLGDGEISTRAVRVDAPRLFDPLNHGSGLDGSTRRRSGRRARASADDSDARTAIRLPGDRAPDRRRSRARVDRATSRKNRHSALARECARARRARRRPETRARAVDETTERRARDGGASRRRTTRASDGEARAGAIDAIDAPLGARESTRARTTRDERRSHRIEATSRGLTFRGDDGDDDDARDARFR